MKRVIQLMVIICLILGINTITYASSEIKIDVNGSILQDAEAILKDGSTLLPVRSVGNALGGEVIWDNATKTASIDKEGTIVTITIGQQAIDVNGVKQQISTPAQIVSGRTYVPLRALGEALDCNITWINETKTVKIEQINPIEYKAWYEVDDMGRIVVQTNINAQNWDGYTIVTGIDVDNDDWRRGRTEWDTDHRQKQGIVSIRPRGFYSHYEDGTVIKSTDIYIFKGVLSNLKDSMKNPEKEIASVSDKLVYHTTLKNRILINESDQPMNFIDLKVSKDSTNMREVFTASVIDQIIEIGEYDLHYVDNKNHSYSSLLYRKEDGLESSLDMGFYPYTTKGGAFSVSHTVYTMDEKGVFTLTKTASNTIDSSLVSK